MKRIYTFLLVAMAFMSAIAQVEPARGTYARVEPTNMYLTCMVGETVTDTVYVYNISSSSIDPLSGFNSSPGYIWTEGVHGPIPPGGVGKAVVTYTPEAAGTHTASLSMNIKGEYYSVKMTGVATEPEQTEPPYFVSEFDDEYYTVSAIGNGDVYLYCEGELVDNPYLLPRAKLPYTVQFTATAKEEGKLISDIIAYEIEVLPAPYTLVAPELIIEITENGDYVINVNATEGIPHLLINGEEVGIPYVISMQYEEQVLECEAYCAPVNGTWAQESEHVYQEVTVPAKEMTTAPIITIAELVGRNEMNITVDDPEAEIFYRVCSNGDVSDWNAYDGYPIVFVSPGEYQVDAYAVALGKLPSGVVSINFIVRGEETCYDFEENGVYYKITGDNSVSVTSRTNYYSSYSGVVTIPNTVTHDGVTYMVTGISENAFYGSADLTAVTIGDYVTSIGYDAFRDCKGLTHIVLGDYVITVADNAFYGCSNLKSVTMGKGLDYLGYAAFGGCKLLTDVICKAATPPTMFSVDTFDSMVYQSASLHVYPPVMESYKTASDWSNFSNIVGESQVSPVPNDINGDGVVNISDVISLVDKLLGTN